MKQELAEYLECVAGEAADNADLLEASYQETCRFASARGQEHYLLGIRALHSLGRGQDLVLTYVQEMPVVIREVGEDVVVDVVEALMKLSSLTSGSVLTLILGKLPLAAQRLGDADLLRGYLKLLHQLASQAPRGLRPMIDNLGELLQRLTLGGLRRWALWGARAYPRDFDGQQDYFGLASETARSMLQREHRGTLLVDNQRRLNSYLRALWGRAFLLRPTSEDYEDRVGGRPTIDRLQVHLPDAFDDLADIGGLDVYRAAVAHAAAHIVFTRRPPGEHPLEDRLRCFVDLFEDARIEALAWRRFPGLRRLWRRFFEPAVLGDVERHPVVDSMLSIGRALLDAQQAQTGDWIGELAGDFHAALAADAEAPGLAVEFGLRCQRLLSERFTLPALRVLQDLPIPYRDDNRYTWSCSESALTGDFETLMWLRPTERRHVSLMEMVNEVDSELVDQSPQEIWVLPTELFPYEDHGQSYNQLEGVEAMAEPRHYDEWDYQLQLSRPEWSTVLERRQAMGDPAVMDDILTRHRPVANRIRHLIDALQPRGILRQRGCEDGEELDIDAAVRACVDIRRGVMPDPRVNIRITRHYRDLSMLLLLDLSESTNDRIGDLREGEPGYEDQPSILDLAREATGLLAWAVDAIGDRFAIHGFASDGRHDVQYTRFKDFDEAYGDMAKARLAGMRGALSTRMGAALRHAGACLGAQPNRRKLLLLLTDGAPADVDERDPQYLRHDTKQAIEELAARGIHCYCLSVDPAADDYAARIFGDNNYSVVDNLQRLPERLPRIFSALTS